MNVRHGIVFLQVVLLIGCSGSQTTKEEPIERGLVDRSVLDRPEHQAFRTMYDTVHVQNDVIDLISKVDEGVDVTVFFGTWCPDSRREVPRFLRIVDRAGMAGDRIKLYALDRTKKSSDGLTEQYHIERVPTFIFLKNGEEIGRITESARTTLEGDMLNILAAAQKR